MILQYLFKKENKVKNNANFLYKAIVYKVSSLLSKDSANNNFLDESFEISTIFLFCIFFGFKKNKFKNKLYQNQILMNLFIEDLDRSLREIGVSDIKIGKYVKLYVKKFYFRIPLLENIFVNSSYQNFETYLNKFSVLNHFNYENKKLLFTDLNFLIKEAKKNQIDIEIFKKLFIYPCIN